VEDADKIIEIRDHLSDYYAQKEGPEIILLNIINTLRFTRLTACVDWWVKRKREMGYSLAFDGVLAEWLDDFQGEATWAIQNLCEENEWKCDVEEGWGISIDTGDAAFGFTWKEIKEAFDEGGIEKSNE
jgi:hypothetical protein